MFKKIIFIVLSFALICSCNKGTKKASHYPEAAPDCANSIKRIDTHAYMIPGAKVISNKPRGSLCETIIESKGSYLTIYSTDDFVLVGDLFKQGKAITNQEMESIKYRKRIEAQKQLSEIVITEYRPTTKNINQIIYMIADPNCGACKYAKKEIIELSERYGVTIKLVLFDAISSPEDCISLACSDLKFEDFGLTDFKNQNSDGFCEKGTEKIMEASALLNDLGITGVPTFIFADSLKQVVGADIKTLEAEIIQSLAHYELNYSKKS